jgi:NADH-quinone oxidoreductase subunit M
MVLRGSFPAYTWLTVISGIGMIVSAAFLLWTIQRILLGAPSEYAKDHYLGHLNDIDMREIVSLVPLMIFMVVIGVYPSFILNLINSTVTLLLGKL